MSSLLKSIGRSFRCPGTFSPLALSTQASVEKAGKLNMDWIMNMGLAQPNTKRYSKIEKIQSGTCASMCAPHANQNEMLTVANYFAWLVTYDDDFVHCDGDVDELHHMASTIEQTINEYRSKLFHQKSNELELENKINANIINANVYTQCLSNIIETLYNGSNGYQIGSFMDSVLLFLAAHPYTLHNLKNEIVPRSDLYLKMRYLDVGLDSFMDACLASNVFLNDMDLRLNECSRLRLHEMKRLVNKHVMLVNDVFSLEKELNENDYHNMVLILMTEQKGQNDSSMEKALNAVMDICDEYVNAFESFEENLVFMETSQDYPIAKAYMDFLKQYWIGVIMWHDVGTKRYIDFQ